MEQYSKNTAASVATLKIHPQANKHLQTDEETQQHIINATRILQNRNVWGGKCFQGLAAAVYISCVWVCWRSNGSVHTRTCSSLCFSSEIRGQVLCSRCPETSSIGRLVAERLVSVRQCDSWRVWPCTATGKGWGWPTSWPSPLPVCPLLRRAGPLSLSRHHLNEAGLPLVSLWTGSFPSVLWMVTSAWSWWGTLGVWVWIYDAGRKAGDSWVPHLADWEHTQGESLRLFPVPWSWSRVALRLPGLSGGSAVWTCLCSPASFFPLHFLSLHLLPPPPPPLYLWAFPYCSAWLSSGSFCGEEPHLCRSCAGWRCRLWCWHHWSVTRTSPTGSSGCSCGTLQLLQLERRQKIVKVIH